MLPINSRDIPHPDPNYHYLWCPATPDDLADYLQAGYEQVQGEEEAVKLFGPAGKVMVSADTYKRVRSGTDVLLRIPMRQFALIEEYQRRRAEEAIASTRDDFHNSIDQLRLKGVSSFEQDAATYADERAFNERESNNRVAVPADIPSPPPAPPTSKRSTGAKRKGR